MKVFPNRVQRAMIDLIEACEVQASAVAQSMTSLIGPGTWDARALRDYATVCLLLPQRSGKSQLTAMVAGHDDVIVFGSLGDLKRYEGQGLRTVGFDNLPPLKEKKRLWIHDAFWTGLIKGPDDKSTQAMYTKIAKANEGGYISIILLDSPF